MYLRFRTREALDLGERGPQVGRHLVDDTRAPALPCLPLEDVSPELPVEREELTIDGQRGPLLRRLHPRLQLREPLGIARRPRGKRGRHLVTVIAHSIPSSSLRSFAISASSARSFAMIFFGGSYFTSSCFASL